MSSRLGAAPFTLGSRFFVCYGALAILLQVGSAPSFLGLVRSALVLGAGSSFFVCSPFLRGRGWEMLSFSFTPILLSSGLVSAPFALIDNFFVCYGALAVLLQVGSAPSFLGLVRSTLILDAGSSFFVCSLFLRGRGWELLSSSFTPILLSSGLVAAPFALIDKFFVCYGALAVLVQVGSAPTFLGLVRSAPFLGVDSSLLLCWGRSPIEPSVFSNLLLVFSLSGLHRDRAPLVLLFAGLYGFGVGCSLGLLMSGVALLRTMSPGIGAGPIGFGVVHQ
jgi:hypothetical protein